MGLWDLWVNSMPTLTFELPEGAANAVNEKRTGYAVWDNQEKEINIKFNSGNWEQSSDG